jgi:hypothetical protein
VAGMSQVAGAQRLGRKQVPAGQGAQMGNHIRYRGG